MLLARCALESRNATGANDRTKTSLWNCYARKSKFRQAPSNPVTAIAVFDISDFYIAARILQAIRQPNGRDEGLGRIQEGATITSGL